MWRGKLSIKSVELFRFTERWLASNHLYLLLRYAPTPFDIMEIANKTKRPLSVPLPAGKRLLSVCLAHRTPPWSFEHFLNM